MEKVEKKEELTIEQRIEQLKKEQKEANIQVNEWQALAIKKQGAIEVLEQMLKEE